MDRRVAEFSPVILFCLCSWADWRWSLLESGEGVLMVDGLGCVIGYGLTNAEGSDCAQTRHDDATHGIEGGVLVIGWIGYDS